MKIGIDISLVPGEKAGVGVYSYNLVKYLSKIDKVNEYVLYPFFCHIYHPEYKLIDIPIGRNFKIKFKYIPKKIIDFIWMHYKSVLFRLFGNVDVLHSTTFCVPKSGYRKLVVTIYDVSFVTHPQFHIQANIDHCLKGTQEAVLRADKIITISRHTKSDLVKYFEADPDKITVTYLGYDETKFRVLKESVKFKQVVSKYRTTGDYILSIGSLEPRKNIISLIKAYLELSSDIKSRYTLVIGGGRGWLNSDAYEYVKKAKADKYVKFIGYVEDEDLPYLYNGAGMFVYPSLYEGFGLPVLEAMACGCPVITSNVSSIPEVMGDAGLLVDPLSVQGIKSAITKILAMGQADRKRMIKSGLKQAKRFSWKKCAKETLNIYNTTI